MLIPKLNIIRDPKYIEHIKSQTCILTGYSGSDCDAIDPMHIGTLGKGIKSSDDEVIPALHSLHQIGHQNGEITMIRNTAPDWLLREALRAYAREEYRKWKGEL